MKIFRIVNGVATMDSFLDCYTDYPMFLGRESLSERRAGDGGNALIRPGQAASAAIAVFNPGTRSQI